MAHVAAEMGISRVTAHKWVRRWRGREKRACTTGPVAHTAPRTAPRRAPRPGYANCARPVSSARPVSAPSSACPPPPCTAS
ncbi:hypothetical protein ACW23B_22310 [Streptomyces albidoflavus]